MISLKIEPYCETCPSFKPALSVHTYLFCMLEVKDTGIHCENREICKNMCDFLAQKTENLKEKVCFIGHFGHLWSLF